MNESTEQSEHEAEGATAPSAAEALPLFGPAQAPELPAPPAAPAAPAAPNPFAGHYDAPGFSDVADALSASDDGLPGGPTPSSSGFSWRLGGGPAPVMHSQGGIPNEFDHLFRDSDADARRSLMPSQGPIGVTIPPAGVAGARARSPHAALPPAPSRTEANGSGADPQLPAYQPPVDDSGYPQQPYTADTYQQAGYQQTTQVPVGAAATGVTDGLRGADPVGGADERHTQAIPRVPVQTYGAQPQSADSGADLLSAGAGRNSTPVMLISVGVFIVLVVLAAVAFSGGGGKSKKNQHPSAVDTPTSAANGVDLAAKAQADAVYALIAQSKGLTGQASGAIQEVLGCKNVAAAQQTFNDIATKRQAQVDQVKTLPVDKIPGGTQVVADLAKGWQFSADSERELAGWAGDNLACTGKPGSNDKRALADADGGRAGTAKAAATAEWNALAAKAGQPTVARKEDL